MFDHSGDQETFSTSGLGGLEGNVSSDSGLRENRNSVEHSRHQVWRTATLRVAIAVRIMLEKAPMANELTRLTLLMSL